MLNEISQSQKENTIWFLSYKVPKVVKFIEIVSRMAVSRGCVCGWGRDGKLVFNGY